jgi:hypothetical protein
MSWIARQRVLRRARTVQRTGWLFLVLVIIGGFIFSAGEPYGEGEVSLVLSALAGVIALALAYAIAWYMERRA